MPVFKMDYAHKEYQSRFGFEPRAYGVQTMRYDVDHIGNIKGVYTQILEETDEGMVVVDGTERHWPLDLVLLSIGFIGTETTVPHAFDIQTERNKIVAIIKILEQINLISFCGDARRGQSLVVWAIQEGRAVANSVDEYLKEKHWCNTKMFDFYDGL